MLKPPPRIATDDWAVSYRTLSEEKSYRSGPWDHYWTPHLVEPMRAMSDPDVHEVVLKFASQCAKTEGFGNDLLRTIHLDPYPTIVVHPTDKMAEDWSKNRLMPMLRDCKPIQEMMGKIRSRDSSNTIFEKHFPGMALSITGANSPANLAGRPIGRAYFDEIDRYPESAGDEGDPFLITKARVFSYGDDGKVIVASTPTTSGASRIDDEYELGHMAEWHVPCHECGTYQAMVWAQVVWEKEVDEQGNTVAHHTHTAVYKCAHCDATWNDTQRRKNIQKGEWVSAKPLNGIASFHMNQIGSMFSDLSKMAADWISAQGNPHKLKAFFNTKLGISFADVESRPEAPEKLMERRETYPAPVPASVAVLTAGADVGKDNIHVEIVGWGYDEESWSIDYHIESGDPVEQETWDRIEEYIAKKWKTADGRELRVMRFNVDAGFHTQTVANVCMKNAGKGWRAIKGEATHGETWPAMQTTRNKSKRSLWRVNVESGKTTVIGRLRIDKPGPGYSHFPDFLEAEYFTQLTNEQLVKKGKRFKWSKKKESDRVEALDCRVYAYAALCALRRDGLNLNKVAKPFKDKAYLYATTETADVPAEKSAPQENETHIPVNAPRKKRRRRISR